MEWFWLILAYGLGGLTGFVVFALLKMSQDSRVSRADVPRSEVPYPAVQPFDQDGDTVNRI